MLNRIKQLAVALFLFGGIGIAQSVLPNTSFAPQSFTASAQTGATVYLTDAVSSGTVLVYGSALTTITWAIQGSNDGGATWYALNTAAITAPGTLATTETTTSTPSAYLVNLAGITNVRFVTSGTFTATGAFIKLTASGNKGLL